MAQVDETVQKAKTAPTKKEGEVKKGGRTQKNQKKRKKRRGGRSGPMKRQEVSKGGHGKTTWEKKETAVKRQYLSLGVPGPLPARWVFISTQKRSEGGGERVVTKALKNLSTGPTDHVFEVVKVAGETLVLPGGKETE